MAMYIDRNRKNILITLVIIFIILVLALLYVYNKSYNSIPINRNKFSVNYGKSIQIVSNVDGAKEMCVSGNKNCNEGTGWILYQQEIDGSRANIKSDKDDVYAWYKKTVYNDDKTISKDVVLEYKYNKEEKDDKKDSNDKKIEDVLEEIKKEENKGNVKPSSDPKPTPTSTPIIVPEEKNNINENYNSIVPINKVDYHYGEISSDMDKLVQAYPQYARKVLVGYSRLGRPIYSLIVGNTNLPKSSNKKLLIIGNMHAREVHSSQIIMKQAELYLKNMNNYYNNRKLTDIFSDSAIYFIPTTNPDGNEIVFDGIRLANTYNGTNHWNGGYTMYNTSLTQKERNNLSERIKEAVRIKMKYFYNRGYDMDTMPNNKYTVNINVNKNDKFYLGRTFYYPKYNQTVTYQPYSVANMSQADRDFIKTHNKYSVHMFSPDYKYKDLDLSVWRANANGVDLHYNFYEEGINQDVIYNCVRTATCNLMNSYIGNSNGKEYIKDNFSSDAFVGTTGISEPETMAVRDFINNNGLYEYAISYHGSAPYIIWNYTTKFSKSTENTERISKFKSIAYNMSKVTKTVVKSDSSSLPIGFMGWYQQKYRGIAMNIEIGFSGWDESNGYNAIELVNNNYVNKKSVKVDACPISITQLPFIWELHKYGPLDMVDKYISHGYLSRVYK